MHAFVDILNAKRILVNGTSLDTVETLKEKISKTTGLPPCLQTLHVLQNGTSIEWKDNSSIYFGDLIKKNGVIYLSCKKGSSTTSYYINIVTETGRVLLVTPEGGKSTTINDLKQQLSIILGLRADSLFLRVVELSKCINRRLGELFNTLEDYCVISGAVLYVQIHPWSESWFYGKIRRDQAEEIMSSASEGQFLVKESVSFPGDYVLFVRDAGQVKHFKVSCHKNMMFAIINGHNFFYTIAEMIQFYMSKEGLPIKGKLKEPVTRSEPSECTGGEGLTTGSSLVRPRLHTTASTEIHVNVVTGSKTFSLLTSTLNQVQSLKAQIEEKSGEPADCQLLRLNDKLLVMDSFYLSDYHVMENSTIYVQVHPWDEDWYVGNLTHNEIESLVKSMSTVPKDGMFLIRNSCTSPGNYCVYVWWKGNPVRYLVEFKKNRFTIGNEHQFNSLSDLVEYYRKCRGRLKSQLTDPVKIDKELKCFIPPAVVARGSKAKAAYRRALESGKTYDVRVRIMLIGDAKAGKTSLKRSLKGEKFNKQEASTLGVDMDAPLLKDGLKAWSAHKAVENISVFDHRSAQLVARQLSEPNGYPTSDLPKAQYPARKGFSCGEAICSERSFPCRTDLPSTSNGVSNGIAGHCKDIHSFKEGYKGMPNTTDHYEELPSPLLQDDVFTSDQVISDPLPTNIASLVEDILTSDQDPSDNLPQNVANLVERVLRQEHFSASEEVWPVIWDFSGQSLLHGMNPIFMSREAVYLLVCDLTKDLFSKEHTDQSARATTMQHKTDSCFDHLVRWMDLVHSFQDTSAASVTSSAQPPVILVGTHADKVSGDPWNRLEAILDSFHGKQFSSHIVDKFSVDNTRAGQAQEDPTILTLRQKIISVASSLPHTNREIPLQWLRVEKVLHRLAAEGFKYITLQQFKTVAKRVCRFQVDEDSDELLHFLCDCGAVLCFKENDESNSLVFLDPQWLVRLFCQIIAVVSGKKEPINIRQCRQTLAKKGILSEELVNFACQESDLNLSKESLLSVMEKASLVCRLEVQNGEVVYLVPSMLPATPENEILGLIDQYITAPVYITFNTGYIPYGLFSRFVVLFSDWASKEHSARPPKMSANAARFFIGKKNDYSLTFAFFKSVVMVHVLREGSKEEETEITAICQQVYRCIEGILDSLHLRCHWLHSITWKLCARCDLCLGESEGVDGCTWHRLPSCPHPDCAHFIPLDPDRPLRCDHTIKSKTLLDDDKLKPWLKHFGRNYSPDDLCFKAGVVSRDDLLYLAHDVGLQWKRLCRILLGAKEVEHIDHDQKTLDDKCYTMLDRWKTSQASDATYAALGMALMNEDLQTKELCEKYCLQPQVPLESSV